MNDKNKNIVDYLLFIVLCLAIPYDLFTICYRWFALDPRFIMAPVPIYAFYALLAMVHNKKWFLVILMWAFVVLSSWMTVGCIIDMNTTSQIENIRKVEKQVSSDPLIDGLIKNRDRDITRRNLLESIIADNKNDYKWSIDSNVGNFAVSSREEKDSRLIEINELKNSIKNYDNRITARQDSLLKVGSDFENGSVITSKKFKSIETKIMLYMIGIFISLAATFSLYLLPVIHPAIKVHPIMIFMKRNLTNKNGLGDEKNYKKPTVRKPVEVSGLGKIGHQTTSEKLNGESTVNVYDPTVRIAHHIIDCQNGDVKKRRKPRRGEKVRRIFEWIIDNRPEIVNSAPDINFGNLTQFVDTINTELKLKLTRQNFYNLKPDIERLIRELKGV